MEEFWREWCLTLCTMFFMIFLGAFLVSKSLGMLRCNKKWVYPETLGKRMLCIVLFLFGLTLLVDQSIINMKCDKLSRLAESMEVTDASPVKIVEKC